MELEQLTSEELRKEIQEIIAEYHFANKNSEDIPIENSIKKQLKRKYTKYTSYFNKTFANTPEEFYRTEGILD